MRYVIPVVSVLSACSAAVPLPKPSLPVLTDGASYSFPSAPTVLGPVSVEFGADTYRLKPLTGSLDVNDLPVCDAVRLVVSDGLGVQSSCTATGNIWFNSGADTSSGAAFRAFVIVLQRSGAVVSTSNGVFSVSGDLGDVGGGVSDEDFSGDDVEPLGGGAYRFTSGSVASLSDASEYLIDQRVGGGVVVSVPGDSAVADALKSVAQSVGYGVSSVSDGSQVYLSGLANEVSLVKAAYQSDAVRTVSLLVPSLSDATVLALVDAFPDLTVSHDPDRSTLYVRGFGSDLQDAMPALRSHISEPRQFRLNAAFVEWSSRSDLTLASSVEAASSVSVLSAGSVVGPNSLTVAGDLSATLSALESIGSTTVLATPSLTVLDGRPARFVSGDQVPFLSQTETDDGDTKQTVEYRDTGVVLNVQAFYSTDHTVRVRATIEVTSVRENDGVLGNPIFSTRLVETSIQVTDGQSVVLSGLALDGSNRSSTGVPGLSRSGLLGRRTAGRDRSELLFILTPHFLGASGSDLRSHAF